MIWRLGICFSLLCAILCSARAGVVSGTVVLENSGTGRESRDLSGVVISLEPVGGKVAPAPVRARMLQKNKTFSPHVLTVPVGSTIDFPNADPIFHNAFSNFNGQIFDIGLYPPGKSRAVVFRRPGVVRVFCNIHPAMSAVIVVVDTPYFGVTDREGRYRIAAVPAGTYQLTVFHERATSEVLARASRTVEVGEAGAAVSLTLSEAGYLPTQHANKFGKAYPRDAGERGYSIP